MTQFRSKQDGTHYPIVSGNQVYPRKPTYQPYTPRHDIDESKFSDLDKRILIRNDDFFIQHKTLHDLEEKYNLHWFTYEDKEHPLLNKEDYDIGSKDKMFVSMRPGHNEGYIVEIQVWDEKTYEHIGWLRAKTFDKKDALRLTTDLWNLKRVE